MDWRLPLRRLRRAALREEGQDLVEYALLVVLIALAAVLGLNAFSDVIQTRGVWDAIANLV